MNNIQEMYKFLTKHYPDARITLDKPLVKDGVWSMDVFLPDFHLAVAWKSGKGFGLVWDKDHGYGEGAQEVYTTYEEALPRVIELINGRK